MTEIYYEIEIRKVVEEDTPPQVAAIYGGSLTRVPLLYVRTDEEPNVAEICRLSTANKVEKD